MLSSGHSYIEMALVSLGFSHIQLNQRDRAREYYQTCLQQFPQSQMGYRRTSFSGLRPTRLPSRKRFTDDDSPLFISCIVLLALVRLYGHFVVYRSIRILG